MNGYTLNAANHTDCQPALFALMTDRYYKKILAITILTHDMGLFYI